MRKNRVRSAKKKIENKSKQKRTKPIIIIGLTGSIGMGKSTAGTMLMDMGVPVHDSDQAVHDLMAPGGNANAEIGRLFPEAYDSKTGQIDRKALGRIVFSDPEKREILEDVLHPLVRDAQDEFVRQQSRIGVKIVALDIPLLFETGSDQRVDVTLVVSAPYEIQKQRVLARPNMTEEKFEAVLKTQMPDEEKRLHADYVIETGIGLSHTRKELEQIVDDLKNRTYRNDNNRFSP